MRVININPPSGYIICADYKYGQLSKTPIDVAIGKNTYSGYGVKFKFNDLLSKVSTKTKENLLGLTGEGVIFEYGITFAVDRNGTVAWSIPIFGQFENVPIVFWRKETESPMAGQTLLYIRDIQYKYSHVKKDGLRAFIGFQNELTATKIDKQRVKASTKSIDELLDI